MASFSLSGSTPGFVPGSDMDSIFGYMDEFEMGHSPDEIEHAVLDPMIADLKTSMEETAEKIRAKLETRLREKEQLEESRFSQIENLDITKAARDRIDEQRTTLKDLKKIKRSSSESIARADQDIETANETHAHLITQFQKMGTILRNTPIESKWTQMIAYAGEGISRAISEDVHGKEAPKEPKIKSREEI